MRPALATMTTIGMFICKIHGCRGLTAGRSSRSFSFFDGNALFTDIGEDCFKLGFGAVIYMVGFLTTIGEKNTK